MPHGSRTDAGRADGSCGAGRADRAAPAPVPYSVSAFPAFHPYTTRDAPRMRTNTARKMLSVAGTTKNASPHNALTMPENSIQPHIGAPTLRMRSEPAISTAPNSAKKKPPPTV